MSSQCIRQAIRFTIKMLNNHISFQLHHLYLI
jgi:hypothetical protein